jgi:16S rRNA (adenine1518-N6/adenine1519-N6)-dimethyltransferase
LRLAWEEIAPALGSGFKVVSNLPYQVSTAILTRLLREVPPGTFMILMFQKEVGDRIAGGPRGKEYGSLSVFTQMVAKVRRLLEVAPQAFSPPPKVFSSVLKIQVRETPLVPRQAWTDFEALLQSGFRQRRKMLRQNLRPFFGGEEAVRIERRLEAIGASPQARAEELSVEQWVKLFPGEC